VIIVTDSAVSWLLKTRRTAFLPLVQPPNILLIHSDQHRFDSIASNGNPIVSTPNLDRLAREGTNFTRAFTTIPICSPARASLMTGAWPTTHGCLCIPTSEMWQPARRELPVLSRMLTTHGYHCAMTGKFHKEFEGSPTDFGFEEFAGLHGYRKWRESMQLPPQQQREKTLLGWVDPTPPEATSLAWQADQVIRQIEARTGQQPFFVRWDPPEPHLPCVPPQAVWETYANTPIPPWNSWPDPLTNKPAAQRRQVDIWGLQDWPWERFEEIVRRYFAIITHMDAQIGRVLDCLDRLGIADNTLVIYSTDHGDYCGGHGQMDKHFNMYEDVVHVPLLLRWPGQIPANATCDAFASNSIDIARTIAEAAQLPAIPDSFQGENLVACAKDPGHRPRNDIYCQYFGTESGAYSQRMLRSERYKYVFNPTDLDELYDLETDPGELTNRIDDPALAPTLAHLRQRLWDWMKSVKDPLGNRWTEVELLGGDPIAGTPLRRLVPGLR